MKKTGMKLLCILLSALLAFYLFPQCVLAEALDALGAAKEQETGTSTADAPAELVSKRRENAKYFKMPDGSYLLAQYADAIHEKKADGTFEEIDNTLKKGLSGYTVSGGRVRFASNTKAAKTVQIKNGDYEISFGLLDAKKSKIETVEKEKKPAGFYLKEENAIPILIDLLEDEDVRLHAISALSEFKREAFRCYFERFQNSTHPGWRKYARLAIKKLNG